MITLCAFHTSSVFRFSAPASALLGCTEPLHISPGLLNQSAGRVHGEAKPRVSLLMTLPHNNIDVRHYYSSCTSKAVKTSITSPMGVLAALSPCRHRLKQGVRGSWALPACPIHNCAGPSCAFTLHGFIKVWVTDQTELFHLLLSENKRFVVLCTS